MNSRCGGGKKGRLYSVGWQVASYHYLVSITMIGPHAVNRMLPTAYGTV